MEQHRRLQSVHMVYQKASVYMYGYFYMNLNGKCDNLLSPQKVLRNPGSRRESQEDGTHSHMNGNSEVRRSGRARRNKFETLNQSLLFDQLVNR